LFTLPTVACYQRWPQANNDVTVKTLYSRLEAVFELNISSVG